MAGEWRETTLGEFAPFAYGKGLPERTRNPSGNVPVFGSNGIVGFHSEPLTSGPTIIIGRKGTVGAIHFSPKPCWPIDTTFYVAGEDSEILRFKYYFLKSLSLEHMNADSAVPGLNREAAHVLKIRIPPLPEQRAIAHILGTLDDKIELNRRMSQTLEQMARALFKAWFVDFEPVRAKMEGRWKRDQSLPGLPAHLYDLFPNRLVDSELGKIPEGWRVGTLGDVAEHPRRNVQPGEVEPDTPYIALEHMPRRCIRLADWGTAGEVESNKYAFQRGELLFGKLRPYFHKVGVAPVDGVCSTDIVVVTPKSSYWFGFVLGHISSTDFVEYANIGSTGTKMPRTSWADMARYKVAVPPESVTAAFAALVEPFISQILGEIHESRTLAALRDALLPKLISGKLRVKDAERFLNCRGES
ncbi:MAG: restriction endonuclease subunit S [Thermodesulforhabdaceae bacterium]|jgi:type I restriction enzyme S subunit